MPDDPPVPPEEPPAEDPYPWVAGLGPVSAADVTARRRFTP